MFTLGSVSTARIHWWVCDTAVCPVWTFITPQAAQFSIKRHSTATSYMLVFLQSTPEFNYKNDTYSKQKNPLASAHATNFPALLQTLPTEYIRLCFSHLEDKILYGRTVIFSKYQLYQVQLEFMFNPRWIKKQEDLNFKLLSECRQQKKKKPGRNPPSSVSLKT